MTRTSTRVHSLNLGNQLIRYRLALLLFTLIYMILLLLYLGNMSIQWDEATHLNTGITMLQGNFNSYLSNGPFYPPLYDLATAATFKVLGISLFNARLVSVIFAVLSMWTLFEFVNPMYGPKVALISSIMLAITPGFVWLSRLSMIETMLLFFFMVSLLFFYKWLKTNQIRNIVLSGVALGLGFIAKYQAIVGILVIFVGLIMLTKIHLKSRLKAFLLLTAIVAAFAASWFLITFQVYASQTLNQWLYALQMGNPQKSVYSLQFPAPIFYLIAMTWPYGTYGFAPVSIFTYIFALVGLIFLGWRRRFEDKFLLIWFFSVYLFFTLIGNKDWRYIVGVFPVLTIAAANLIVSASKRARNYIRLKQPNSIRRIGAKFVAVCMLGIIIFSVGWNCIDTTLWMIYKDERSLPVEEATSFTSQLLGENESLLVIAPFNQLSDGMVRFYLQSNHKQNQVWQYPSQPVDTYQPNFNTTVLIDLCQQDKIRYLLVPGSDLALPLFNTTMNMHTIYDMMNYSGRFRFERSFGNSPYSISLASFS